MKKELIQLKIVQVLVDALLILAAFALAYFLRIGFYLSTDFPFHPYALIALATLPFTIVLLFFSRAYRLSQQALSLRHLQRIAYVSLTNVAVFMVLYYFAYRNFFSRLILVYLFLLTFAFVYGWHVLFRWIMQKMSEREIGVYRALIIGAGRPAEKIIRLLLTKKTHIRPVAVIDAHGTSKSIINGVPVVGRMNRFEKTIADHAIDVIIQTDHLEQTVNIVNYALMNHLDYMMPPELMGIFQGYHTLEETEGSPFIKLAPKKRWWHVIW